MQVLSVLVLILLSLAAYSAGAAGRAGKKLELKPQLGDLALVVLIWSAAVSTRAFWHIGHWRLLAFWAIVSGLAGFAAASLRKLPAAHSPVHAPGSGRGRGPAAEDAPPAPETAARRILRRWTDFSKRMGNFQSRVLLSFFFFIVVTPFALIVKIFADPLRIGHVARAARDSYWLSKEEADANPEDYRRQF